MRRSRVVAMDEHFFNLLKEEQYLAVHSGTYQYKRDNSSFHCHSFPAMCACMFE